MKFVSSSETVHPGITSLGYTVVKRLGKGAFGEVWAVKKGDGKYAMKEIKKSRHQESEIETLKKVKGNPHVVEFIGVSYQPDGTAFLLMEYITGGTLADRVQWQKRKKQRFRESKILTWVTGLSQGLAFIHCMGITHRDLKTANIFLTDRDQIKIGDFGMATLKSKSRGRAQSVCGTPIYMSPEMWSRHSYTEQTDLWSLGVILYEVTALRKPFRASSQAELCTKVTTQLPPPLPTSYSPQLRSVISALLSPCPESRPSASTLPLFFNCSFSAGSSGSSVSSGEGGWI